MGSHTGIFFKVSHFRLLQLFITLGLILLIAGGTTGSSAPGAPSGTSQAGIVFYIVAFLAMMLVLFVSLGKLRDVPRFEGRVALGVLCAAPFLLVRLAYSVLAIFLHDHDFNLIDGSVVILVCMRVLEEFIVVFIYIFLGFFLESLSPEEQGPISTRVWKERKGNKGTPPPNLPPEARSGLGPSANRWLGRGMCHAMFQRLDLESAGSKELESARRWETVN